MRLLCVRNLLCAHCAVLTLPCAYTAYANLLYANPAVRSLWWPPGVTEFGNTDPVIHNYLLSLYASETSEQDLLQFLRGEIKNYDMKHALRLCIRMRKIEAAIQVT